MTALRVHTARYSYRGPDRLDVTRLSAGPDGLPFAPSWRILRPMLALRHEHGAAAVANAWPQYAADYVAEMRDSFRGHRDAWTRLLARAEVTLVCYCTDAAHCHRALLAEILTKLGATYAGERSEAAPPRRRRARAEEPAPLDELGAAILKRVQQRQHPHFRAFVVASAATGPTRPTESR